MKTRPTILFLFIKPSRLLNTVLTPESPGTIYCRITVRGQRTMISTGIQLTYAEWDASASRAMYWAATEAKLSRTAVKQANEQIVKMLDQLTDIAADLNRQSKPVTARRMHTIYKSGGAVLDVVGLYEAFLAERKALVGIEIAHASYEVAKTRHLILKAFLAAHSLTDLRPEEFTHNIADKMLYWMLGVRGFKRNYANKVLQGMSQSLRWGVRREHLDKNPMGLYQLKAAEVSEIKYLNIGELQQLTAHHFPQPYLDRIRDLFVFQCWTGLAYADLAALDVRRDAEYHNDGHGNLRRVLRVRRAKSTTFKGYECVIPLLPEAERVLAKYADKLPVISNARYNAYLKEIGQVCDFPADKMTTHVGRKTAGVMMLNAGIRMETVSKFLGHSSVKMTEKIYAKILDTTVVDDFSKLFGGGPSIAPPPPTAYEMPAPEPIALRAARRIALPTSGYGTQKGGTAL